MQHNYRTRQLAALAAWNEKLEASVFGTLKFTSGYSIADAEANRLIKLYWNKLDRLFYGQGLMRKGFGVARLVYLHKGESGENTHFHFLARPAFSLRSFAPIAERVWRSLDSWTSVAEVNAVISANASAKYIGHELHKLGSDTIHAETCFTSSPPHNAADVRSMRQLKRLLPIYDAAFLQ